MFDLEEVVVDGSGEKDDEKKKEKYGEKIPLKSKIGNYK